MKIPEYIICASGEVTLAIARYLELTHGVVLAFNLDELEANHYFFDEGRENIIRTCPGGGASWSDQRVATGKGFKTLREFVASIKSPSWRIGCRTVEVKDGALRIESDDITISKSTLEEMLAALE